MFYNMLIVNCLQSFLVFPKMAKIVPTMPFMFPIFSGGVPEWALHVPARLEAL